VNLALGGSVYQDLTTQFPSPNLLQHHQKTLGNLPVHTVKISQGSQLFQIFWSFSLCKFSSSSSC
ncbi:gamma-glutamyl-gamma-aminobutyrate hydrolase family protein, partial [Liquorilactobacillus vini]|uniref:gamma-glutamyl-gamma-aminobutyrate hydrolase family protein n=1 Tax=Liquorilactobacillus vini TaxID=238015 RepID=UPI00228769F5